MSNILSDWRQALVTYLAANLQGGTFTVESGVRDGQSFDRKLACVFVPDWQPDRNVNFARPPMVVRAWWPKSMQPQNVIPVPPDDLEQLAVDLMTTLEPVQTSLVAGLYFWVSKVRIDYEDWGVEAQLTSWTRNVATLPS